MDTWPMLSSWAQTEHFPISVLLPFLVATASLLTAHRDLMMNLGLLALCTAATTLLALPPFETWMSLLDPVPENLHTLPLVPIGYLFLGAYTFPSVHFTYGATFFSLLIADIFGAWTQSAIAFGSGTNFLLGVGGAGLLDGLVWLPITAASVTWIVRICLLRGIPLKLFGRRPM